MGKKIRLTLIFLVITGLPFFPFGTAAFAQEEIGESSAFNTFADAFVLRPVGLIMIPAGFCGFVISLPFSAFGGNVSGSFDKLVVSPIQFTFNRPLGDI